MMLFSRGLLKKAANQIAKCHFLSDGWEYIIPILLEKSSQ
jgi:hypothetical protein